MEKSLTKEPMERESRFLLLNIAQMENILLLAHMITTFTYISKYKIEDFSKPNREPENQEFLIFSDYQVL